MSVSTGFPRVMGTAVYNARGQFVFWRVGDDVFFGSRRAFYVIGNAIYDEAGSLCYHIDGVWWFAPDGTACYYQESEIDSRNAA
jgi:hypothetical protein